MRHPCFLSLAAAFALPMLACGGDDAAPADGGPGDAGMVDGGGTTPDAGPGEDAGGTDAGPTGCTSGCEIVQLVTGTSQTCARRENGTVRCWGNNESGATGDGRMGHGNDCAPSGSIRSEDCTDPVDVTVVNDATQISSRGGLSVCAIRADQSVWCWGRAGISDMRGVDLLRRRYVPELIDGLGPATDLSDGWMHMCVVSGGHARCIGNNFDGQLGTGDTVDSRSPVDVAMPTGVVDIEVSPMHGGATCALTDAAEIWCWGNDNNFQLGNSGDVRDACPNSTGFDQRCSLTPIHVEVPSGVTPVAITMGVAHACLLSDAGGVYCWGESPFGQLGQGDVALQRVPTEVPGLPPVAMVRAGARATCALDTTGQVWCWGGNEFGTIGDDMMSHGMTCDSGSSLADCVTTPQQVVGITDATLLALGWKHACALRASGEVWCWGQAGRRQLSNGSDLEPRFAPVMAMGVDG